MSFDGILISRKVLSESIYRIDRDPGVVVEVLDVHSSVSFELFLDEEFIEFWWYDLMFDSPHATNFCRVSTM